MQGSEHSTESIDPSKGSGNTNQQSRKRTITVYINDSAIFETPSLAQHQTTTKLAKNIEVSLTPEGTIPFADILAELKDDIRDPDKCLYAYYSSREKRYVSCLSQSLNESQPTYCDIPYSDIERECLLRSRLRENPLSLVREKPEKSSTEPKLQSKLKSKSKSKSKPKPKPKSESESEPKYKSESKSKSESECESESESQSRPQPSSESGAKEQKNVSNRSGQGGRTREKTIAEVIKKVGIWRQIARDGCPNSRHKNAHNLQDAANLVGIPKKTLDDYLALLKKGNRIHFDFNSHAQHKIGFLRRILSLRKAGKKRSHPSADRNSDDIPPSSLQQIK